MAIDASTYFVSLNSVDLSGKCLSVGSVDQSREEQDITAFGDVIRKMQQTLEASPDLVLSFNQDFAGGSVHATISPLYTGKTTFAVELRPTNAARSATNPGLTFNAYVVRYAPMDGAAPGGTLKATVTLRRVTAISFPTS